MGCAEDETDDETTEPPTFTVNEEIEYKEDSVPTRDEERDTKPAEVLVAPGGVVLEVVEDELIVTSNDEAAVEAFADEWDGEVVRSIEAPEEFGVDRRYVVRIDPSGANVSKLGENLQELDEAATGEHIVTSSKLHELLAVYAETNVEGDLSVQPNWLMRLDDVAGGSTLEGANSNDGDYTANAYEWPYMDTGSTQDIGAAPAWTLLERSGAVDNRVSIAILDGGFLERPDHYRETPSIYPSDSYDRTNVDPTTIDWHGTHVAEVAMAEPDDGEAVAGPAGQIADPIFVQSPALVIDQRLEFGSFLDDLASLTDSLDEDPDIINMSFSIPLPPGFRATATNSVESFVSAYRDQGALSFAAAGNDGNNIDSNEICVPDDFDPGFLSDGDEILADLAGECHQNPLRSEVLRYLPCEAEGVTCVGGLEWDSDESHDGSNVGEGRGESVDIFGPYEVWATGDPERGSGNQMQKATGTSFATPFVAGVAAQIWAADPTLEDDEVLDLLLDHAHTGSSDDDVNRWVNAYDPVAEQFENFAPHLEILSPADGAVVSEDEKIDYVAEAYDVEDETDGADLEPEWFEDGTSLGEDNGFEQRLCPGTYNISAEMTDSEGETADDSVSLTVMSNSFDVSIDQSSPSYVTARGGDIDDRQLQASAELSTCDDPDSSEVDAQNIEWSDGSGTTLCSGDSCTVEESDFPTDSDGNFEELEVTASMTHDGETDEDTIIIQPCSEVENGSVSSDSVYPTCPNQGLIDRLNDALRAHWEYDSVVDVGERFDGFEDDLTERLDELDGMCPPEMDPQECVDDFPRGPDSLINDLWSVRSEEVVAGIEDLMEALESETVAEFREGLIQAQDVIAKHHDRLDEQDYELADYTFSSALAIVDFWAAPEDGGQGGFEEFERAGLSESVYDEVDELAPARAGVRAVLDVYLETEDLEGHAEEVEDVTSLAASREAAEQGMELEDDDGDP